ncbi:uncharacterized protein LOC124451836 [Xenia sp. Carnegie-2017]|uniref:uncharacterized protein LOC124451836 n=1 Tax=Xenia sp. Carnegie-2017 TaxID=2897299 RepID=UPI001F04643F|nr:uncharacterized protein LOC124451836 [Xenia sp. Carnegie-2017]
MKVEELKTEIIKGKKDGNMMERLKDGLRLEVENLQEKLNNALEKISTLQSKQLHDEEEGIKEKKKLLKNMKEYESRNGELILDIDRASKSLNLTKEKYGQLKGRFKRLTKKYTEICEEKINKSDAKVGPDTSEDLSLIVEDLQRSKDNAERENSKLRTKMDGLLEEIGRSEYQIRSVRKANVVLMKQTRCLYEESEQQKRIDEEKTKELQEYRRINQSLKDQEKSWQKNGRSSLKMLML